MKYLRQFGIILAVTCAGEIMKYFIPLPIPGSIYGLILMFVLLLAKVIKVEHVKETGEFLIEDHAAYVYPGRCRTCYVLESVAVFPGATSCNNSSIYICSYDCDRKSDRFLNFKKRREEEWII